jgi:hypothetical protein
MSLGTLPEDMSAEVFLRLSTEPVSIEMPEPKPQRLRVALSAMCERPCWEAEIPIRTVGISIVAHAGDQRDMEKCLPGLPRVRRRTQHGMRPHRCGGARHGL